MTPAALLAAALRTDPARPLVTFYDETRGERVELSVTTVANWVAKTGNALVDEWGLEPGDSVAVDLPAHWVGVVTVLAIWSVGGELTDAGAAATGLVRLAQAAALTDRELLVTLEPMGMDLSRLVASWPDAASGLNPSSGDAAVAAAAAFGLPRAARVLSALPFDREPNAVVSVVAPLAAGGSTVVVRDAESATEDRIAELCRVEQVTHTAGLDVAGLPRLV